MRKWIEHVSHTSITMLDTVKGISVVTILCESDILTTKILSTPISAIMQMTELARLTVSNHWYWTISGIVDTIAFGNEDVDQMTELRFQGDVGCYVFDRVFIYHLGAKSDLGYP